MSLFVPDGVYPDGGWTLANPPLFAAGFEQLVEKLTEYRRMAGIPVGDPRADVLAEICGRGPGRCRESDPGGTAVVAKTDTGAEIYPKQLQPFVLSWLGHELQRAGNGNRRARVAPGEARRRAALCLRCPAHLDTLTGCAPCQAGIREARDILAPKPPVDPETLGGCAAYRADVSVLTTLDFHPSPPFEKVRRSPDCWREHP